MIRKRFKSQPLRTRIYVLAVIAVGAALITHSIYDIASSDLGWRWTIFAFLTLLSGSASISLPASASVSISETFVFTSAILFGPSVGTVIVALDAAVISFWSYRRGQATYKILFNICALPIAIWAGSTLFFFLAQIEPLFGAGTTPVVDILAPLFIFTVVYFSLNSWIVTFAIALERNAPAYRIWRESFAKLSLNYFGGASIAALFVAYSNTLDVGLGLGFFALAVPLLAILYFVFSTTSERVKDASRHLAELNNLYLSTIETLAMAIDAKDQITHGHIRRVQAFATGLAQRLGVDDQSMIQAIEAAALLHDMGKLAVPEYILNKPGPLTSAEFDKMKLHASVGADILSSVNFPYPVVPIVRHHHENWDGTGYPDGLKGTEIPIGARILSVVDCFDALTSDRPYRPRLTDAAALRILLERRGNMYDPLVVDAFVKSYSELQAGHEEAALNPASLEAISQAHSSVPSHRARQAGLSGISASSEESLALYELTSALTSRNGRREVAEAASRTLRRIIPASTCVFYRLDTDSDELNVSYAAGEAEHLFLNLKIARGQRLSGWVAANLQTIMNSDPVLDLGSAARTSSPRLRSCLSTPIAHAGELFGVLTLYSTNDAAFDEDHRRIVETVAQHVALAAGERSSPRSSKKRNASVAGEQNGTALVIDAERLRNGDVDDSEFASLTSFVGAVIELAVGTDGTVLRYDESTWIAVIESPSNDAGERLARVISDSLVNAAATRNAALDSVSVRLVAFQRNVPLRNLLNSAAQAKPPAEIGPLAAPKHKSIH